MRTAGCGDGSDQSVLCTEQSSVLQRRDVARESGTQITVQLGLQPFGDIE